MGFSSGGFGGRLCPDGETIKPGIVVEAEDCGECPFVRHSRRSEHRRCVALSERGRALTMKFPPKDCPLRDGLLFKLAPAEEGSDGE